MIKNIGITEPIVSIKFVAKKMFNAQIQFCSWNLFQERGVFSRGPFAFNGSFDYISDSFTRNQIH